MNSGIKKEKKKQETTHQNNINLKREESILEQQIENILSEELRIK